MKILGISAYYHDSAAALIENEEIIAAAQEERFTRTKHDAGFPEHAIVYCLKEAALTLADIDAVVFYDKPFLKFERVLQNTLDSAPMGWWQFIKAMPAWLNEKLFIKNQLKKALKEIGDVDWSKTELLFSKHHLSHAASSFYPSSFNDAAILTIDGVGEWATASISKGYGNQIDTIAEMQFPDSLGLLYSAFTYYLGFKVNSGEYKVMGLAPYAKEEDELVQTYVKKIKEHILQITEEGAIVLNKKYFTYTTSFKMINEKAFQNLFDLPLRKEESKLLPSHWSMAKALQLVVEEVVLKMATYAKTLTGAANLCMAGGVALNCVANGKIQESGLFENIYIQPAAGDAGTALGAALAAYYMHYKNDRKSISAFDTMKGARIGPSFNELQITRALQKFKLEAQKLGIEELIESTASVLNEGSTVGWFQGRMEFGPRALGGRSILGNPIRPETQSVINLKVKQRESFRPFAPIMLEEEFKKYFGKTHASPYMLLVHKILPEFRKESVINNGDLITKINEERSVLPAITHVDYSARIQTVNEEFDIKMFQLLNSFKAKSGFGVLVNTSFNLRGEPIVCSPEDAIACFLSTEMDYLVLDNFFISREKNLDLIHTYVTVKLD